MVQVPVENGPPSDDSLNPDDSERLYSIVQEGFGGFINHDLARTTASGRMVKVIKQCQDFYRHLYEEWLETVDKNQRGVLPLQRLVELALRLGSFPWFADRAEMARYCTGVLQGLQNAIADVDTALTTYDFASNREGALDATQFKNHLKLDDLAREVSNLADITQTQLLLAQAERASVRIQEAAERATGDADAAGDAADSARDAAGTTGAVALDSHFSSYADVEDRRTKLLRWAAVLLGTLAAAVVVYILETVNAQDYVGLSLIRLSIALPLIGLSAYFLREATHARADAAEARRCAVRLKTIRAYTAELPEAERLNIRAEFGRSIFLGSSASEASSPTDAAKNTKKIMDSAAGLLHSARE